MPLVLGIDSSTQSTKVEIRDADSGALVARGSAPHPATTPPRSEQDPGAWWDALGAAITAAGDAVSQVDAVAVAGQQHGMVVLDAGDQVVRPAKLWNDTESAPDAQWLIKQLGTRSGSSGEAAWAQACGSVPVAAFTITKLSWLHRSEPDAWARLARVCLPHDWLTWKLTGAFVTDRGDASGTGYFSPALDEYDLGALAIVDGDADWAPRLPRVLKPLERAGTTTALGLDAIVAPGTGDNMAAALALALRPGDVAISLGTSGTVYTVSESPAHDSTGAVAGFADATGKYLPLVCTLNATKVTDSMARWLGLDLAGLDALALAAPPGSGGVVVVPYLDGERTPNRPDASGAIFGLRTGTSREQLARAAVEGVVCGLLDGLDALIRAGVRADGDIVLIGGGARSPAYQQVVADLSGRSVAVPDASAHVATGACVQAAAVLWDCDIDAVVSEWDLGRGATVEPDPSVDRESVRAAYTAARCEGYRRAVTIDPTNEPMDVADSILDLVGNTPLVRLRRLTEAEHLQCTLVAKVETVNPGGSVKDRVAIAMVDAAERDGLLLPGGTIVEPTSGNTGAGLAIVAAQRGYRCIFVMSDKMSDEKIALLRSYGAEVVVCPTAVPPEDPRSYYSTAERLVRETPGAFRPDQYSNAANPLAHEQTTGPEIWSQTRGRVTHFVAGVGTGGTITGVGRALKARNPSVEIIGADPSGSVYSGGTGRPYLVEGVGEDFWPATFDRSVVDRVVEVTDADSFLTARRVTREEGLHIGGSGGTAVHAALEIARPLRPDAVVVVLVPDSGRSYLTKIFDDRWMFEMGFLRGDGPVAGDVLAAKGHGLPALVVVLPDENVRDAITVMRETGVSQVVVSVTKELPLAAKEVVGTLRELELMDLAFRDREVLEQSISEIMSPPMPMLGIGEPVARMVECLELGPSVLVLDGGHPIGVLTRSDVLSFLAERALP